MQKQSDRLSLSYHPPHPTKLKMLHFHFVSYNKKSMFHCMSLALFWGGRGAIIINTGVMATTERLTFPDSIRGRL